MSDKLIDGYDEFLDYENSLRNVNRFIVNTRFHEYFDIIIKDNVETLRADAPLYRSRANKLGDKTPYKAEEIGMNKLGSSEAGRANPKGISYMYLSEAPETSIAEIRRNVGEYISVGEFRIIEDIRVVCLSDIALTDSYHKEGYHPGLVCSFMFYLSESFASPVSHSRDLACLPCQYFCEYCKNIGLNGVKYRSSAVGNSAESIQSAYNIVLFTDDRVMWNNTAVFKIDRIKYETFRLLSV